MSTKYLKAFKTKNQRYWWLVEVYREGGKLIQKKLKYYGVYSPGEEYREILMPLDDNRLLNDLSLIWKTSTGVWHWQRRGDFEFWCRRGQEKWFWKSFSLYYSSLLDAGIKDIWLIRASNRSEAIKKVDEKQKAILPSLLVELRMRGFLN